MASAHAAWTLLDSWLHDYKAAQLLIITVMWTLDVRTIARCAIKQAKTALPPRLTVTRADHVKPCIDDSLSQTD